MSGNGLEKQKGSKKLIVIICILALLLVVTAVILAFVLGKRAGTSSQLAERNNDDTRNVIDSTALITDSESATNVLDELTAQVAEGMFECKMSMNWSFEDGKAKSKDAYVANSENNTHPIFFDVYLKDTDELIYSSPVLSVGAELYNFSLDKPLEAGEYKAKVKYSLLDNEEEQNVISSASFVITINISK